MHDKQWLFQGQNINTNNKNNGNNNYIEGILDSGAKILILFYEQVQ